MLEIANSKSVDATPKYFTDVLYMSSDGVIPLEIKKLLKQKKLSFSSFSIDKFNQISHRLDLIGTAIIGVAQGLDTNQEQKLARVIESLEMNNVGTIVLKHKIERPVKSFSLTPSSTSFSMSPTMEMFSIEDLWFQLSANLAHRKRASGMVVKPSGLSTTYHRPKKNHLSEQIKMAMNLVEGIADQLRLAGQVQKDFLPDSLPDIEQAHWIATFLPAEWVSGDIYDVVRLDEDHIGFYIADAVGHAMPAALLTIFIKQAMVMREVSNDGYRILSPSEVVTNLNRKMTSQKLSGYQFATCCYCLLNTKTLELTYARAGHPYPILIRQGEPFKQLEVRGALLGVFEQSEFLEETIQLQPGDKLFIYSDGAEPFIGNIKDEGGFEFYEEFVKIGQMSAKEMIERFTSIVKNAHTSPAEIDDVTAVVMQVK